MIHHADAKRKVGGLDVARLYRASAPVSRPEAQREDEKMRCPWTRRRRAGILAMLALAGLPAAVVAQTAFEPDTLSGAVSSIPDTAPGALKDATVVGLRGDVDGTGTITTTDALYIGLYLTAARDLSILNQTLQALGQPLMADGLADVDGTGTITTTDALYIQLYLSLGADLVALNATLRDQERPPALVGENIALTADFSLTNAIGTAPLDVGFTDTSLSGELEIVSRLWQFGDGLSSTERSPQHVYTTAGTYSVSLSVTTSAGTAVASRPDSVLVAHSVAESVDAYLDTNKPIDEVVEQLEASLEARSEQLGLDSALAELDGALANSVNSIDDLLLLIRRSDDAGTVGEKASVVDKFLGSHGSKIHGSTACPKTSVIFVNGINTLHTSFLGSKLVLRSALDQYDPHRTDFEVKGVYNRSAADQEYSVWGKYVCPLAGIASPEFAEELESICRSDAGLLIDLREASEQRLRDWAVFPLIYGFSTAAREDLQNLRELIQEDVRSGRKVIVLAHSQGNLFVQDAVKALGSDGVGDFLSSVAVVQVASPAATMSGLTARIDHCEDIVSLVSTLLDASTCVHSRTGPGGFLGYGIDAHYFDDYMRSDGPARAHIMGNILGFQGALENPRSEASISILNDTPVVFSPGVTAREITVFNENTLPDACTLSWHAEPSDSRLQVTPSSFEGNEKLVTIAADYRDGLAPGFVEFVNEYDPAQRYRLDVTFIDRPVLSITAVWRCPFGGNPGVNLEIAEPGGSIVNDANQSGSSGAFDQWTWMCGGPKRYTSYFPEEGTYAVTLRGSCFGNPCIAYADLTIVAGGETHTATSYPLANGAVLTGPRITYQGGQFTVDLYPD